MKTKLKQMQELWEAGDYRGALKMAAGWPQLGEHKAAIQSGWAATWNPAFYRQLGRDPVALYEAGLAAMAQRYNLEPPKKKENQADE